MTTTSRDNYLLSKIDEQFKTTFINMNDMGVDIKQPLMSKFGFTEKEVDRLKPYILNQKHAQQIQPKQSPSYAKSVDKVRLLNRKLKDISQSKKAAPIIEEMNELNLDFVDDFTIKASIQNIVSIETNIVSIKTQLKSYDDGHLQFDIKQFCREIDEGDKRHNKSHKIVTRYAQIRETEREIIGMKQKLKKEEEKARETSKALNLDNKCPQEIKVNVNDTKKRFVSFKGEDIFNRIKRILKDISELEKQRKGQMNKLRGLLNEATWKKEGRLKSKLSLRERADNYEKNDKNKRNTVNKKRRMSRISPKNDDDEPPKKKQKQNNLLSFFKQL